MEFLHLGVKIRVGDDEIRRILLERLRGPAEFTEFVQGIARPRIGAQWEEEGGIYSGIVRGRNSGPDTCLIIGPEYDGELGWDDAQKYVKGLNTKGFTDWRLMYRPEGAVAYANVPELFGGKTHWTCEQHAEYSGVAWCQFFTNGTQSYWVKSLKFRARAVRSAIIQ